MPHDPTRSDAPAGERELGALLELARSLAPSMEEVLVELEGGDIGDISLMARRGVEMPVIVCRFACPHTDPNFGPWTALLPIYSAPHELCYGRKRRSMLEGIPIVFNSRITHSVPRIRRLPIPVFAAWSLELEHKTDESILPHMFEERLRARAAAP